MDVFREQLLHAWRIHQEKNFALIDCVKQAGLEATLSTRGGRTVGQQLVHVHAVRLDMLENLRKDLAADVGKLAREQGHDRALLRTAFEQSGAAVERLIETTPDDGKVKMFKGGLVTFVCYLIAHESHHRGGIVLTLKQAKQSLGKDSWKLWGWSKGVTPPGQ